MDPWRDLQPHSLIYVNKEQSLVYCCDPSSLCIYLQLAAESWIIVKLPALLPVQLARVSDFRMVSIHIYDTSKAKCYLTFKKKKLSVTFNPIIRCSYNSKQVKARFSTMIYLWSDQLPQNNSKAEDVCPVIIRLMVYYLVRHATLISMVHI